MVNKDFVHARLTVPHDVALLMLRLMIAIVGLILQFVLHSHGVIVAFW